MVTHDAMFTFQLQLLHISLGFQVYQHTGPHIISALQHEVGVHSMWYYSGERFEAAGEEMERELSLASFPSEVERLREAVAVPHGPAFDDVGSDFYADPGLYLL